MAPKAVLTVDGKTYELPVVEGSAGEQAIDITTLREKSGLVTYDPSLGNTAVCKSAITFVDGEKGILRYRGIPVQEFLTAKPNFVEVVWLLIFGRLPARSELERFSGLLTENELLHQSLTNSFDSIPVDAPPMAILSATLSNLAYYHQELLKVQDVESLEIAAARLISKIRTIAAFSYRRSRGLPFIYPDPKMRYCANLLHMMFSLPYRQYEILPEIEDALNLVFILHADHEQNCSTTTTRVVCSAQANLFASCAAAVCALWGPLHGGANVEVMDMLERIRQGGMTAEDAIRLAKDKSSPFKLSGFGHRIYKNYDPRARILKAACDRLLNKLGVTDPLLDIARRLEELALADPYFVERRLYPNVDFYSGIVLRAIGFPTNMFTVLFAIGRLPGWIAQWREQHEDKTAKIVRPRQIYTGAGETAYTPLSKRADPA